MSAPKPVYAKCIRGSQLLLTTVGRQLPDYPSTPKVKTTQPSTADSSQLGLSSCPPLRFVRELPTAGSWGGSWEVG